MPRQLDIKQTAKVTIRSISVNSSREIHLLLSQSLQSPTPHMFSDFASKGLLLLYAGLAVASGASPLYKDPKADINHRVSDLLGRMTIEEKAAQLLQGTGIQLSIDSSVQDG